MREILFRGKKQNGEWLQGDLVNYGDKILIFSENAQNSPDYYEVEPETVGQFTGVTDKNGVKIFEGDILIQVLYKENYYSCVKYIDNGFYSVGINGITSINILKSQGKIVIGNIHENPELLK